MIKLGVNIDHIATIREARKEKCPSIINAAEICEKAGADSITVHLREDRRHIQDSDVYCLRKSIKTKLNLEMAINEEIIEIATNVKPNFVCLVPEKRQELTTEGGLDVKGNVKNFESVVARLKRVGIVVSMFIDPDINQVLACSDIDADAVELHTGKYASFFKENHESSYEFEVEMLKIIEASHEAINRGLLLNAGHGLNYGNLKRISKVPGMNEFNIGFSIVAMAVFTGLEIAVRDMKNLLIGKD